MCDWYRGMWQIVQGRSHFFFLFASLTPQCREIMNPLLLFWSWLKTWSSCLSFNALGSVGPWHSLVRKKEGSNGCVSLCPTKLTMWCHGHVGRRPQKQIWDVWCCSKTELQVSWSNAWMGTWCLHIMWSHTVEQLVAHIQGTAKIGLSWRAFWFPVSFSFAAASSSSKWKTILPPDVLGLGPGLLLLELPLEETQNCIAAGKGLATILRLPKSLWLPHCSSREIICTRLVFWHRLPSLCASSNV